MYVFIKIPKETRGKSYHRIDYFFRSVLCYCKCKYNGKAFSQSTNNLLLRISYLSEQIRFRSYHNHYDGDIDDDEKDEEDEIKIIMKFHLHLPRSPSLWRCREKDLLSLLPVIIFITCQIVYCIFFLEELFTEAHHQFLVVIKRFIDFLYKLLTYYK